MSAGDSTQDFWKKCSSCKKAIPFHALYWLCSVSTCNQKRTGWVFCSVDCWDAHVPKMNHKECWAVEKRAPSVGEWKKMQDAASQTASSSSQGKASSVSSNPTVTPGPAKTTIIRRPAK